MNILKREDPQTIANILNGKQTILVMKQAPKNGEGCWWYLYCSKGDYLTFEYVSVDMTLRTDFPWGYQVVKKLRDDIYVRHEQPLNGKVVARFWCDKVNDVGFNLRCDYPIISWAQNKITRLSCLSINQLTEYLQGKNGYAIHISKLEIFDKPRELSEFQLWCNNICTNCKHLKMFDQTLRCRKQMLTKAPQNYCYIESEG